VSTGADRGGEGGGGGSQGAHVELVATERAAVSPAAVMDRLRRVAGHDDIDYMLVSTTCWW
jgi:hypothetical protein